MNSAWRTVMVAATIGPALAGGGIEAAPSGLSLAPPVTLPAATGPVGVSAHPDPLALLVDADPVLAANKRLVFDMWRSIVNAGHVELADEMLREDYIQHSPVLPTGRAAFKTIFSAVKRRDIPPLVAPPLVTILAEGRLVVMALREDLPEPSGKGVYTTTHFNMFRVEDGRLAEHWHSVQDAPGPNVLPPARGGPQRVTGATGAAQLALLRSGSPTEAENKRLVFDAWRRTRDAGSRDGIDRYFSRDYVDHDPTVGPGRKHRETGVARQEKVAIARTIRAPLVAMVAQGDLVVLVTARVHPFPGRPGDTYTTSWFDMYRISKGRIAEHWTGANKPK